jgi:bleomycin hydrolase
LEKSNLFLQGIIDTKSLPAEDRKVDWLFKHALGDGGQFTGVSDIITKYGLVPAEVMPETYSSNNTSRMSNLLNLKLKEFGLELREMKNDAKKLEARKVEMLSFIYRFLVLNLGEPPTEFEWTMYDAAGKPVSTKKYTPKSFYDEYVGKDLKGSYVLFMNDPTREFYKVYEIEYDRHQYDGANWVYVNLPIEEIKKMAIASIKDSTMMYFSCDVGKFYNREKGILDVNYYDYGSLMGTEFGMDKRERILTGSSGSSHAMTLMAVDLDENGNPKKWMVENSWGMTGYKGHLIMTDEWFDEYMFRVVVDKKYVPQNILELMKQKPTMLPPWDPMFAPEE